MSFVLSKVMQTKHLHLILLLALVAGCKPVPRGTNNPYLFNNKRIVIEFDGDAPAVLFDQRADLRLSEPPAPSLRLRVSPYLPGFVQAVWCRSDGHAITLPRGACNRSLVSLWLEDRSQGIGERATPLPGGRGVAFMVRSPHKVRHRLSLSGLAADSILLSPPRRVNKSTWVFRGPHCVFVMAASARMDSVFALPSSADSVAWTFSLVPARQTQVVLLLDRNEKTAVRDAARLARISPAKLEELALEDLRSHAAFALNTESDSTNRVFALLASALIGASPRVPVGTRAEIADAASMATALYLAARARPSIVFPDSVFTFEEARDNLRWGGPAYRAALNWGMASDDSLRALAWSVIAGLSSLQRDYVSSDVEVLSDWTNKDALMRQAVAHVQLADLMTLGEEISFAQGEHQAQGTFRKEALRARRTARRLFTESARQQHGLPEDERRKLAEILDSTAQEDDFETPFPEFLETFPDTSLFLLSGARFGFNWLDDRPELFWNPRLSTSSFVWQRWTAYRLRSDLTLKHTADFDSLLVFVLDDAAPGMLTERPHIFGEPSLLAMAAAFQNLAEAYLGVRPEGFRKRVQIEPRLPAGWGHTTARVPFRDGFIVLNYDFAREFAMVGAEGVSDPVEVFFGYPLETAGYLRTQFVLQPGDHPTRIQLEHKPENRLDLKVFEVP
jgi:hypothetical protein